MAAVLGGTQSLHTNSMDETLALPTRKAAEIALRTQQLIAFETGVANVADPLGGSWYIESLTDRMEKEAEAYFKQIEDFGGVIPAIEEGFFQREIAHAASDYQKKVDERSRVVVGTSQNVYLSSVYLQPCMLTGVSRSHLAKTIHLRNSSRGPRRV